MPLTNPTFSQLTVGARKSISGIKEISNYLEDDFDDNSLTNRSNTDDGVYPAPDSNYAGDVLVGRYRPQWQKFDLPSEISATNGVLKINNTGNSPEVRTASQLNFGSWKEDFKSGSSSCSFTNCRIQFRFIGSYKGDNLSHRADVGTGEFVVEKNGTIVINGSWSVDTNTHTRRITRDVFGNTEQFLDGTSQGTSQVSLSGSSDYLAERVSQDTSVEIDNLVIQ